MTFQFTDRYLRYLTTLFQVQRLSNEMEDDNDDE
jgi:hypothetical protein